MLFSKKSIIKSSFTANALFPTGHAMNPKEFRTWIELDKNALYSNARQVLRLLPKRTRFMAVVKSNAYGHGLTHVASALEQMADFRARGWFGVDSIVEAVRLRSEGAKAPVLVLGLTLPSRYREALEQNITVTASSFENLEALARLKARPKFHLKIDTGMHRQGFFASDMPKVIARLKRGGMVPEGVYTHFASAKDPAYPTFTLAQLQVFKAVVSKLEKAGFRQLIRHCAASGGTILFPQSHLDMARAGIMLYGYYPSREAEIHVSGAIKLAPILTWKAIVGEVKEIKKGAYVGYDLTERVARNTRLAVIPVGYWHGVDRGLSSVGEVLIAGRRRKILGRVSMDMIVVDVTDGVKKVRAGDLVVLIGRQGAESIWADEVGEKIGTSAYEVLTRINPLIKKIVK